MPEARNFQVYELCRMDDNANTFVMERFASRAAADAAAAAYQARGHKQVYVVRAAEVDSVQAQQAESRASTSDAPP